jgi:predicted nuclease of predicted toxin-antitoxin system
VDAHVQQSLVEALRRQGWDVVRVIEVFPEKTDDEVLFEYAAREGRVFVTTAPIHSAN